MTFVKGHKQFNTGRTRFKKGQASWNKGKNTPNTTGVKNPMWKGENASYTAAHIWVRKWKGKANHCEKCGKTTGKFQWANIDHKYKRVLDDYISMCQVCHIAYDRERNGKYGNPV